MINKIKIYINKARLKIILPGFVCFFLYNIGYSQVRFVKTVPSLPRHSENSDQLLEKLSNYYIPIISFSDSTVFYILKIDKTGNIVSRKDYGNWSSDRGGLFNAPNNNIWKVSYSYDRQFYASYVKVHLLDSNLKELNLTKIPANTYPNNSGLYTEKQFNHNLSIKSGDFILFYTIEAINWIGNPSFQGTNFFRLSKTGELLSNKTFSKFTVGPYNELWQLTDTSIVSLVYNTNCNSNCKVAKIFNLDGEELLSKQFPMNGLNQFKKCSNRYYVIREKGSEGWAFLCFNQHFELLYEKRIPLYIHPLNFWDNRDNGDFRIHAGYCVPYPGTEDPTTECYTGVMDTSFSFNKFRITLADSDLDSKIVGFSSFTNTSDGGALYVWDKEIERASDMDLVVIKWDTTSKLLSNKNYFDNNIIYPNPNNQSRLFIEIDYWQTISIFNSVGQKMIYLEKPSFSSLDGIDISGLRPGNYYLEIKFPDKTVYNKFIRF